MPLVDEPPEKKRPVSGLATAQKRNFFSRFPKIKVIRKKSTGSPFVRMLGREAKNAMKDIWKGTPDRKRKKR